MIEFDILGVDGVTNYKFDYAYGTGLTEEQNNKLESVETGATKNRLDTENADIEHTHTIADVSLLQQALDGKVDKELGLRLSQEDFTPAEKIKLASLVSFDENTLSNRLITKVDKEAGKSLISNTDLTKLSGISPQATSNRPDSTTDSLLANKVDKEVGKGLVDKNQITKLTSIQANATKNSTDTFLRSRANHTGLQSVNTVDGLAEALEAKVVKESGKRLASDAELTKLSLIEDKATKNRLDSATDLLLDNKVDKSIGKTLIDTTDITKLSGIEEGATKNSPDVSLRNRATHTGTQPVSSITGLSAQLDSKVSVEAGKSLQSDAEAIRLATVATEATKNRTDSATDALLASKVDKEAGKSLIPNSDYAKLVGIESGATKNKSDAEYSDLLSLKVDKVFNKSLVLDTEINRLAAMATGATKNRSDAATDLLLDKKVDNQTGKSLISNTELTKLSGIATGATKNLTDTYLLNRGSHTGVQPMASIDGLQYALSLKVEAPTMLASLEGKVDKVTGKSLVLDSEIIRLDGMATGATKNRSDAQSDVLFNTKIDKTSVVQTVGQSTTSVMSQKAVTNLVGDIESVLVFVNGITE